MACKIVERMALERGEKVLLVANPDMFRELVPHLRYEVMKAGGVDLGVIDVLASPAFESWDLRMLRRAAGSAREAYRAMFRDVDAAIMLPGVRPFHPPYAAMQDLLRGGRGRTVHFHWLENGSAFPIPGQPLPPLHVIDATYQRALSELLLLKRRLRVRLPFLRPSGIVDRSSASNFASSRDVWSTSVRIQD